MEANFFELLWKRSFWLIVLVILESGTHTMRSGIHQKTLGPSLENANKVWLMRPKQDWGIESILQTTSIPTVICDSVSDIIQKVAKEAIGTLNSKSHPTGQLPLIIDNFLSGALCSLMSTFFKASNVLYGSSGIQYFKDKVGQKIGANIFSITKLPVLSI